MNLDFRIGRQILPSPERSFDSWRRYYDGIGLFFLWKSQFLWLLLCLSLALGLHQS